MNWLLRRDGNFKAWLFVLEYTQEAGVELAEFFPPVAHELKLIIVTLEVENDVYGDLGGEKYL